MSSWLAVLMVRGWQADLVPLMTVMILATALRRPDMRPKPYVQPSWVGCLMLTAAGVVYLAGLVLSVKSLLWGGYLALVVAWFWACCGWRTFRGWLPVFLFSLFLLPEAPADLRNAISLPLQLLSTRLTVLLAGGLIPITAQGNIFYIRGLPYEVTVACSGLHTWIGFLFAGLLWMLFERFTSGRQLGRALLAVAVGAPLLALLTNSARLWITALVAYFVSPDAGLAVHTNLEYVLFPLGLLLMWLIARRIQPESFEAQDIALDRHGSAIGNTALLSEIKALPIEPLGVKANGSKCTERQRLNALDWLCGGAVLTLLAALLWGSWMFQDSPVPMRQSVLAVPSRLGEWAGHDVPLTHHEREILAPAQLISRSYRRTYDPNLWHVVWLNVIQAQRMGAVHNFYDSLVASGHRPVVLGTYVLRTARGPLETTLIRYEDTTRQPYYLLLWYQWRGGSARDRWTWYLKVALLRLRHQSATWQLVEVSTPMRQTSLLYPEIGTISPDLRRLDDFARRYYEEAFQPAP